MKKILKKAVAVFLVLTLSMTYLAIIASGIADEGEIISNEYGALEALGFDTSAVPEGFDEDSTENPYGTNALSMSTLPEVEVWDYSKDTVSIYGNNKPIVSSIDKYFSAGEDTVDPIGSADATSAEVTAEADLTGSGKKAQVVSARITSDTKL